MSNQTVSANKAAHFTYYVIVVITEIRDTGNEAIAGGQVKRRHLRTDAIGPQQQWH